MKSLIFSAFLLLVITPIHSQEVPDQNEIAATVNESIWKPFKNSYESRDWKTFNALHTADVLRVHDRGIQKGQEYKDAIKGYYEREDNRKVTIDFVLERRTYSGDTGYEVGFYRVIYQEEGKEDRNSYGRFHVVLKKIDGNWKIAQDWDSGSFNGRPIGPEDFDEGKKLDLIN